MTGKDKLKETAEKLKGVAVEEEKKEIAQQEQVKNELDLIRGNEDLVKMYNDNALVGSANLGGSLPILRVHATGKSNTNLLANGEEPNNGWFYYKPTKEQFKTVTCHILTISRGFRVESLAGNKPAFNQIIGGLLGPEYLPFIMYVSGKKLPNLWKFAKELGSYTRAKPVPFPMFSLTVEMSTEKEISNFGPQWIINFDLVKNEDGMPKLVIDPGEFEFLKNSVETAADMIDSVISRKEIKEEEEPAPIEAVDAKVEDFDKKDVDEVKADEIPF